MSNSSMIAVDTSVSSASHTYTIYFKSDAGGASATFNYDSNLVRMIAMEVEG